MIKHNEERKKKYSASSSPSCLFYFFFVFFLFSSSSSYPSRGVIVEFGRETRMDWPLLYITHVIQTIISPYLPRIGHSDVPVPPDGDILGAITPSLQLLSATYIIIKMLEFIGNNAVSTLSIPYVPNVKALNGSLCHTDQVYHVYFHW